METNKKYFMDCHLAGRKYYDANEVWNQLQVGTPLRLVREADNRHDPDAIAVVYAKPLCNEKEKQSSGRQSSFSSSSSSETEELHHIGYIPSTHNEQLAIFLDMGWGHLFDCRITQLRPDAHPEQQVQLVIKVKRNKESV